MEIKFNHSIGIYFPSKCLFGTCSKIFLIDQSIATLFVAVCSQEIIFGDATLIVIGLRGAKNGN